MATPADDPFAGVWDAFSDAGLLDEALIDRGDAEPLSIMVDLRMPDEPEFEGQVTAYEPHIEFRLSDAPSLAKGSTMTIKNVQYRVIRAPRRTEDGVHAVAYLAEA